MASRTVSGTLYHPDGTVWDGGALTVSLRTSFSNVGQTVKSEQWRTEADEYGVVSLSIIVPDTGSAVYTFALSDGTVSSQTLGTGAAILLETIFP